MKVELIDFMGNDNSVCDAARVSFSKKAENYKPVDNVKLIRYLAKHNHWTPFRHTQVQIRCKAPIFLARQLGKHQAGLSWNEVSRRYVDSEPEFYEPTEWRAKPDGSIKQGSGTEPVYHMDDPLTGERSEPIRFVYDDLISECTSRYNAMLVAGVAPEMARMVLPQSMITEWVWSGNILAFAHVYKERIAEGAQLEAQIFAKELDKVIRPLFPESWSALVDSHE